MDNSELAIACLTLIIALLCGYLIKVKSRALISKKPVYDGEKFKFISRDEFNNMVAVGVNLDQLTLVENERKEEQRNLRFEDFRYLRKAYFEEMKDRNRTASDIKEANNMNKEMVERDINTLTLNANKVYTTRQTKDLTVVLVGKTGNGKSETGNSLLPPDFPESQKFETGFNNESVTTCFRALKIRVCNTNITLVDTPGLFDTNKTNDDVLREISGVIAFCSKGVHAFLYVMNISNPRLTNEEYEVFKLFNEHFGDVFQKHCILVLSHGEALINQRDPENGEMTLQIYYQRVLSGQNDMRNFFVELENRIIAVDNKSDVIAMRERNREAIIAMVQDVSCDGEVFYSNELFETAQNAKKETRFGELDELLRSNIMDMMQTGMFTIDQIYNNEVTEDLKSHIRRSKKITNYFTDDEIELHIRRYLSKEKEAIEMIYTKIRPVQNKLPSSCIVM